jgi:hypothetical protein
MPPAIASAAVSAGTPPTSWASDIAIGVVTDFGAIDNAMSRPPPIAHTTATPLIVEVSEPASSASPRPNGTYLSQHRGEDAGKYLKRNGEG